MIDSCIVSMTGDPMTIGHRDIICRARKIFGKVYIALAGKSSKPGALFDYDEKEEIVIHDLEEEAQLKNKIDFEVVPIRESLVDLASSLKIGVIVRGLRNEQDLIYETDMSAINKMLSPSIETIYLPCDPKLSFVSSSSVRELARLGKWEVVESFTSIATALKMKFKMTRVVAVTGGIASGKSETRKTFEDRGWYVIDCDEINRMCLGEFEYQNELKKKLSEAGFDIGDGNPTSTIDIKKLADLVFTDKRAKEIVESCAFPLIKYNVVKMASSWKWSKSFKVAVQCPLLFEPGTEMFNSLFDDTICISAPEEARRARMRDNRGYSEDEIERRLKSQMPLEEKEKLCDYVVKNDSSREDLRIRLNEVISEIEKSNRRKK